MHFVKRSGKLFIRVFPDKPISKKPLETRMGTGKAEVDYWAARVKPGTMLFEMAGRSGGDGQAGPAPRGDEDAGQVPVRGSSGQGVSNPGLCPVEKALEAAMKAGEVHKMSIEELGVEVAKLRNDLYDLRSQAVTEKVEDTSKFGKLRKDIARLLTEQRVRQTAKKA